MNPLDPKRIPLSGTQLIEASAGTGKTYTIALLYLRLLLEKGLSVSEILVVTFTKAATEELRGRIRLRIREALDVLEGRTTGDALLGALLDQAGRTAVNRQRLQDSLTLLDEAAIYTIHSFCQQMLQDHAFESGMLFEVDFLESEAPLRLRILEDFWRIRFYGAGSAKAAWASNNWKNPAGLSAALNGPLLRPDVVVSPPVDAQALLDLRQTCRELFFRICQSWPSAMEEVRQILEKDPCLKRNAKSYRADRIPMLLESMSNLCLQLVFPWSLDKDLCLFSTVIMAENIFARCSDPPAHAFFDLFSDFLTAHTEFVAKARIQFMLEARNFLFSQLDERKKQQAVLSFDDLLTSLDNALKIPDRFLAKKIRKRFPTALVDEFQDTDPLQYRIFKTIYGEKGNLFMIGDPKQAIYSFRGADIFTYILAREQTPETNTHTLDTNYRSTTAMVEAVNTLFHRKNAFIFKQLQYEPIRASGLVDGSPLLLNDAPVRPFQCLWLQKPATGSGDKPLNKGMAHDIAAEICAERIRGLLSKSEHKQARIGKTPLTAGDIAVLVRTHREAELMQQALRQRDIASVYSSRASVFHSPEADDFLRVLTGLAHSTSGELVKNALVTVFFDLNGLELARLNDDGTAWEERLNTMQALRELWLHRGFMPMFQQLIADGRLVRRLSADLKGERSLTNILHLAELVQEAADHHTGLEELVRWLRQKITSPAEENSAQQLRLESDEHLVHIVTIHKAKGLQYPVVFLPFLWSSRTPQPNGCISYHDPDSRQLIVDLSPEPRSEMMDFARREQLAEELRLLYVAMTRACCCCYFCWGHIKRMENTALFRLVHRSRSGDTELASEPTLQQQILQLNNRSAVIQLHTGYKGGEPFIAHTAATSVPLTVARFTGSVKSNWQITSYSRLTMGHDPRPELPDYDREPEPAQVVEEIRSPFHFPRGSIAGTCLHAILEQIEFTDGPTETWKPVILEQLQRAGIDEEWAPVVYTWLADILSTDLGPVRLGVISRENRIHEMGFYFPLWSLDRDRLNALLTAHSQQPLPDGPERLNGLMKGFIDLIFRHQGKFYVVDYKSNYLGPTAEDYGPESMALAMTEHRYDLQYLIYTLALHRYLGKRLPGYDYGEHFGGVFYLFLRGMHPKHPASTGIVHDKPAIELVNGFDRCCGALEDWV